MSPSVTLPAAIDAVATLALSGPIAVGAPALQGLDAVAVAATATGPETVAVLPATAIGLDAVAALATDPARVLARILGLALLSAGMAGAVGALYRWYARGSAPDGLAVLVGLSAVALVLNTTAALGQVLGGADDPLAIEVVLFNVAAFLVAGAAAPLGRRVGDRVAAGAFVGGRELDAEVGQLVRAVGRVVSVELPADVEDVEGYEPVGDELKAELAGKTLVFPRGLTVEELRERLVTRLRQDYHVGHVDVDLAVDGTVEYLGVGRRQAGLGPTLAPGAAAVAVAADPPYAARTGDRVQLWPVPSDAPATTDGSSAATDGPTESGASSAATDKAASSDPPAMPAGPIATAELRAAVGDTVTLAADAADARDLAGGRYRMVTLPSAPRPERALAGLLRAADETLAAVTVGAGSALAGTPVGSLDVTVVAVRPENGRVEAVPSRERPLAAGDEVYVVARPDAIRKVEAAGGEADGGRTENGRMDGDRADADG